MVLCNTTRNRTLTSKPLPAMAPNDADVTARFNLLVDQQALLSSGHLETLHKQWLGPQGIFATFSAEIDRLGRQAPALDEVDMLADEARAHLAERAVVFALAKSNRRSAVVNPFRGLSREALCCVVFDDCGVYTLVERYAAYEAMRQCDSDFFIKLIATTRGVVERRIVFRGLLEHYDRLLPVEKSIYPDAYRETQQAHLDREEVLYGPLMLADNLVVLLQTISPIELLEQVRPAEKSLR